MKYAGVLIALALAAAGCSGGGGSKPVANVGSETITRAELDQTVEHYREEARNEGKPFPREGAPGYRAAERHLLGLLVYRAQLELGARSLGVRVNDKQVEARMQAGGGDSGGEANDEFVRESVKAQLLYEGAYAKVTAGVPPARKSAVMRRWIASLKRRYPPRYLTDTGNG